ncbi:DUF2306 domain-containing protein [Ramlibacter sp. WS9]|uniref:DUF2306 domain-containing protein n=1 Tax=Ramlibacter sp. WS9 TaxID=1882741 RepID=UPI0013052AA3|nr:DUF2306 domain-containing protein [Ramlibacter sp. WS9]
MVVLRALLLAEAFSGNTPSPADPYDGGYARHPGLTLLHIVPGLVFVILGPLQFATRIRARYTNLHRWCGRIYVASGAVVGVSALVLGVVVGFAGSTETTAVTFFSTLFLISLGLAVFRIRRREVAAHREWMIRAFALGLAVTTMRPMVGILTALAGLPFSEALGISFWLAFSLHLVLAECWISFTRTERNPVSATVSVPSTSRFP